MVNKIQIRRSCEERGGTFKDNVGMSCQIDDEELRIFGFDRGNNITVETIGSQSYTEFNNIDLDDISIHRGKIDIEVDGNKENDYVRFNF